MKADQKSSINKTHSFMKTHFVLQSIVFTIKSRTSFLTPIVECSNRFPRILLSSEGGRAEALRAKIYLWASPR